MNRKKTAPLSAEKARRAASQSAAKPVKKRPRSRKAQPIVSLSQQADVLVIDANTDNDDATTQIFQYRQQQLYPALEQRGLRLKRCQGQTAKRLFVKQAALEPNIKLITGSGHGQPNEFTGYFQDSLYRPGVYEPAEVQGRIVHLLSCLTGITLGPDLVGQGCRAFFGYSVNFSWPNNEGDLFFACDAEIDIALAEGATADQAYQRAAQKFTRQIDALRALGTPTGDFKASMLETSFSNLCAPSKSSDWGDSSARLL